MRAVIRRCPLCGARNPERDWSGNVCPACGRPSAAVPQDLRRPAIVGLLMGCLCLVAYIILTGGIGGARKGDQDDPAGREAIEAQLAQAIRTWADDLLTHDIDHHMAFYADRLDHYYTKAGLSRAEVRKDKERCLRTYPTWNEYSLSGIEVAVTGDDARATFTKRFDMQNPSKRYQGTVVQHLRLRRTHGAWLITDETEDIGDHRTTTP
jgi:hypothetical protein